MWLNSHRSLRAGPLSYGRVCEDSRFCGAIISETVDNTMNNIIVWFVSVLHESECNLLVLAEFLFCICDRYMVKAVDLTVENMSSS